MFLNTYFWLFKAVAITVGQITENLTKGVSNTVTGVTNELSNILKGVTLK